jgi:hypothetical protein
MFRKAHSTSETRVKLTWAQGDPHDLQGGRVTTATFSRRMDSLVMESYSDDLGRCAKRSASAFLVKTEGS